MNLADEYLKELDNLSLTPEGRALARCRVSADFLSKGQYEAASEALGELWRGLGQRPGVEGLGARAAAEVLLQVGALSGWMGASQQAQGAQAAAKDLISESVSLFESLGAMEQAAAARSDLSLCYWREGAYDEARVLLTSALEVLTQTTERAKAILRLSIIEFRTGRYGDALATLKENAHIFDEQVSHTLRGSFHNELALVLKQLGTAEGRHDYFDRAIIEYTAAIYHYEQADHKRYRVINENNLANLLRKMGRHQQAHEHLDCACAVLSRLKDAGMLAQVDETRARILIDEQNYGEAERVIARAVQTLEAGGAAAVLAEALTTQGVAWARLGRNDDSISVLRRALKVAEEAGALCNAGLAALTLIEEHGMRRVLSPDELYDYYQHADELLKETKDAEGGGRLRNCARVVMRLLAGTQFGEKNVTLFGAVHELEARLISQALDEAGGSVTRAAKMLGIRHPTVLSLLDTKDRRLRA